MHYDHAPVHVPVPERVASFTASMVNHESSQIPGGALKTRLEAQCEAVVSHLKDVTKGATVVARMDLYFKIDAQNRSGWAENGERVAMRMGRCKVGRGWGRMGQVQGSPE